MPCPADPPGGDAPSGGLPAAVRAAFEPATELNDALASTRRLAHSHYENFSVVSMLLPRRLRQDFCNIYAFCRIADDLADEVGDRSQSLRYLGDFRAQTLECYAGNARTAVFIALSDTVRRHSIPCEPFLDLIDAFEQDQRVTRYRTFDQLLDYCRRSADPVGRLVLYLCGYRDAERQRLSDKTCTALQLINFWQDVRGDLLDRDRMYLPIDSMARFGVTEAGIREQVQAGRCEKSFRELLRFEVGRAEALFLEGERLLPSLSPDVRPQIALFGKGGRAILSAVRRQGYDTLTVRPRLSKWQKGRLILSALAASLMRAVQPPSVPAATGLPALSRGSGGGQ